MATLAEIRQGLSDRAATISGLRCSPYMLAKPEAPACCVLPVIPDTPKTFDGGEDLTFDLWVYTSPADLMRAQIAMDEYMSGSGSKSLKAAIEALPGLGLEGVNSRVVGWLEYGRLVDVAGTQLFGAPMRVEVYN